MLFFLVCSSKYFIGLGCFNVWKLFICKVLKDGYWIFVFIGDVNIRFDFVIGLMCYDV